MIFPIPPKFSWPIQVSTSESHSPFSRTHSPLATRRVSMNTLGLYPVLSMLRFTRAISFATLGKVCRYRYFTSELFIFPWLSIRQLWGRQAAKKFIKKYSVVIWSGLSFGLFSYFYIVLWRLQPQIQKYIVILRNQVHFMKLLVIWMLYWLTCRKLL